jgi:pyridoxal 5'-phosphate synthase pdxT subunit
MRIGVLALQGDFREHIVALAEIGISAVAAKTAKEIAAIDALIIPGGESTTISKLAKSFDLFDLITERISQGMPTYGSCAGMILVAKSIQDPASGQDSFGGIDMVVKRNAFGRQIDSFEADLDFKGITEPKVRGVFIRAPWVESFGPRVEILARVEIEGNSHPVAVREGKVLATAFHPELTGDFRVHRYFVEEICKK